MANGNTGKQQATGAVPCDWLISERSTLRFRHETSQLLRRAKRRPILVGGLVVLGTLLTLSMLEKAPIWSSASIVFRVVEQQLPGEALMRGSRTKSEIQVYFADGILTNTECARLLERQKLFTSQMLIDPSWAVQEFREKLSVTTYQNYFLVGHATKFERSARVKITYESQDPEEATRVVQDIASLIRRREFEDRVRSAKAAVELAERKVKLARDELVAINQRKAELQTQVYKGADGTDTADTWVELSHLRAKTRTARARADQAERARDKMMLLLRADHQRVGLRIQQAAFVVDRPGPDAKMKKLLFGGLFAFLGLMIVVTLCVGAFDPRVYEKEDLERLGFNVLGKARLEIYGGVGSLNRRMPPEKWEHLRYIWRKVRRLFRRG